MKRKTERRSIGTGQSLRAKDLMTRPVEFVYVDDTVEHVASLFVRRDIGAAPVVGRNGELAGLITKTDLARYEARRRHFTAPLGRGTDIVHPGFVLDAGAETIEEWLTPSVHSVSPETDLRDVADLMSHHHLHHLLVLEARTSRVCGIISTYDLARVAARRSGVV